MSTAEGEVTVPAEQRREILRQVAAGTLSADDGEAQLHALLAAEPPTPQRSRAAAAEEAELLPKYYKTDSMSHIRWDGNVRQTRDMLSQSEDHFDLHQVTNSKARIMLMGRCATGHAQRWYQQHKAELLTLTWGEFRREVEKAFPPTGVEERARSILRHAQFSGRTMDAYNQFATRLRAAFLDLPTGEYTEAGKAQVVRAAISGTEAYLKAFVEKKPHTLDAALEILADAVLVAEELHQGSRQAASHNQRRGGQQSNRGQGRNPYQGLGRVEVHAFEAQPHRGRGRGRGGYGRGGGRSGGRGSMRSTANGPTCWACGQVGHISKECPNKKAQQ